MIDNFLKKYYFNMLIFNINAQSYAVAKMIFSINIK